MTALVLLDADDAEFRLYEQRWMNERRAVMTRQLATQFAMAMLDAVYIYVNYTLAEINPGLRPIALDATLTYTQLRNYLAFDLGVPYVLACQIAFDQTRKYNEFSRRRWAHERRLPIGERGWV